jgi:hypothetical protein
VSPAKIVEEIADNSKRTMSMPDLANSSSQPDRGSAICTLFEGDYHYGLAAFVNSLVRSGYAGTVWVGYRGALPPWLYQLKSLNEQGTEYMVADQVRLVFLLLKTDIHLTYYKPQFMLDLLQDKACDSEYIWYFDPDIFLRCNWSFFADWQRYGIALCQEIVNNILPEDSPLRHKWMDIATDIGLSKPRPLNHYFNGGMVGISAAHVSFLNLWQRLIEEAEARGCDLKGFMAGTREMPFHAGDQDALNITAMYTEHPLTTMGPEAMGFLPGGFTMHHAVGPKPWRGSMLLRALSGNPLFPSTKFFFTQLSWPIRPYSALQLRARQLACAMAIFIGRFYCRR